MFISLCKKLIIRKNLKKYLLGVNVMKVVILAGGYGTRISEESQKSQSL